MEAVGCDAVISTVPSSRWKRFAPALVLMVMAPVVSEVLPGATRFSALFALPAEILVWGGGALLIRYAVRRGRLGWRSMLLLALALAIAEECVIQQTSLAPMVVQIKGDGYARAFGVNYVYFLWALLYEVVFVVFLPIYLVEMIFPKRREESWMSTAGVVAVFVLFVLGSCFAWFLWTQLARPNAFHVPIFNPPLETVLIAVAAICGLIFAALGPFRHALARPSSPLKSPPPWVLGTLGALWAVILYGLVLLAFGLEPSFPPWIAVGTGILLAAGVLAFLPCWTADPRWQPLHQFAIVFGTMLGSMTISFLAFIYATWPPDLYFKIVANVVAVGLMIALGFKVRRQSA